jgi:hypothetical protein
MKRPKQDPLPTKSETSQASPSINSQTENSSSKADQNETTIKPPKNTPYDGPSNCLICYAGGFCQNIIRGTILLGFTGLAIFVFRSAIFDRMSAIVADKTAYPLNVVTGAVKDAITAFAVCIGVFAYIVRNLLLTDKKVEIVNTFLSEVRRVKQILEEEKIYNVHLKGVDIDESTVSVFMEKTRIKFREVVRRNGRATRCADFLYYVIIIGFFIGLWILYFSFFYNEIDKIKWSILSIVATIPALILVNIIIINQLIFRTWINHINFAKDYADYCKELVSIKTNKVNILQEYLDFN